MLEPRCVFFPSAEVEVKIVPSIALRAGGLRSCFGCDLLFSCQHCNKVWLPRLASVVGERLLKTMRIRRDVRPNNSDEDGSAIEWLLIEEFAAPILEFAD